MAKTCSVDGCDREAIAKTFCQQHWRRWRKTGDPGSAEIRSWGRGRTCSIEGCDRPHGGLGYCDAHRRRELQYGHPGPHEFQPVYGPRRDAVAYQTAHHRVEDAKGRPDQHLCQTCGAPAKEWAYDHADPNELRCPLGRPYSLDPAHYFPMCVSCHRRFDHAHTKRTDTAS